MHIQGRHKLAWPTVGILILSLAVSGCSVLMAANRSSYRGDITVIQPGVQRPAVIAALGEPDNFMSLEGGGYDDLYILDPDAHRVGTKAFTALVYLAGDFFTLGLTEFVFTPMEIAVKDRMVVYHLVYGNDGKLVAVEKIKS